MRSTAYCAGSIQWDWNTKSGAKSTINLIVDERRRIVTADGKLIRLSDKEYSILELLSLRPGVTVTKEILLGHLYGGKDEPGFRIIDVFVCHLRKKLAQATDGKHYIETVWGRGYRLCAPAEMPTLPPSLTAARNLSM